MDLKRCLAMLWLCGGGLVLGSCASTGKVSDRPADVNDDSPAPLRSSATTGSATATSAAAAAPSPVTPTAPQVNEALYRNPDPAIEALHVEAYNLDLGIGVPQDRVRANALYLQAANAGDTRSMFNLASNLATGRGIQRDEIEAYAWINLARYLTQNSRDMKVKWTVRGFYDELKRELSDAQVYEGELRSRQKLQQFEERQPRMLD